jgi:hypothetical protein
MLDSANDKNINDVAKNGEDPIISNALNVKMEMETNIIKTIPLTFMRYILDPKLLLLPKLIKSLSGDKTETTGIDAIKSMKNLISDMGSEISSELLKVISNEILKDIKKITKKLVQDFLKQRIDDYTMILNNMLKIVKAIKGLTKNKKCTSILEDIQNLLSLTSLAPAIPLPPPLILVAGALKPGLNKVAVINDVKNKLRSKGIETAKTFPDGTTNYLIMAIEDTIDTIITHIKTNASIQVTTAGAGITTGYGQIQ